MNRFLLLFLFFVSNIYAANPVTYIEANVIAVVPNIVHDGRVEPERYCYDVMIHEYRQTQPQSNVGGTIVGGLVGAAIGRSVSNSRDKRFGTALGGVAGAAVGNSITRRPQQQSTQMRRERRCETRYIQHYDERVKGYHVTYEYEGQHYTTFMSRNPGSYVKLKIVVKPVQ